MKAAITGHTRGVGQMMAKSILKLGYEVKGYSRANGHDITQIEIQKFILGDIYDCQIFINNVHAQFSQTELLTKVARQWRAENKIIINVGIDSFSPTTWKLVHQLYMPEKAALHAAAEMLHQSIEPRKCRIVNVLLGHVNTESNSASPEPKINFSDIDRCLKFIIETPLRVEIRTLTLSAMDFD